MDIIAKQTTYAKIKLEKIKEPKIKGPRISSANTPPLLEFKFLKRRESLTIIFRINYSLLQSGIKSSIWTK